MGEASLLELYDVQMGLGASKHVVLEQVVQQHLKLQTENPGQQVRPVCWLLVRKQ